MSRQYFQLLENDFKDQPTVTTVLEDKYNLLSKDRRPQVGKPDPEFGKIITKSENEKVIQEIRKSEKEKRDSEKTIMDMPLREIIEKTSEVSSNFFDDYYVKLHELEMIEKDRDNDYDKTWSNIVKIYILAFVEYLKDDNHVLYVGILFVIIGVILYLFNITSQ